MSIAYTEKGSGLHDAIQAAGHWLAQVDGVWMSNDDVAVQAIIDGYTLEQCKATKQAESLRIAKELRDKVVASISAGEMASWPIKRAEAMTYAASNNPEDAPMLSAEAAARGVGLAEIIARVQGNANRFAALEAAISGADGRHRDAITALQTFEEVSAYDLSAGWPAV